MLHCRRRLSFTVRRVTSRLTGSMPNRRCFDLRRCDRARFFRDMEERSKEAACRRRWKSLHAVFANSLFLSIDKDDPHQFGDALEAIILGPLPQRFLA